MALSTQQIYEAYRKLKNYFYFDNSSLFIRQQIAEFEQDFHPAQWKDVSVKDILEKKLEGVSHIINNGDDALLNSLLDRISFHYITKSVTTKEGAKEPEIIINRPFDVDVYVDNLNMLADMPIELHIISVLWLMEVGVLFSRAIDKNNYAYRFMLDGEDEIRQSGLQLYQPYYIGYQQWRDTALSTALRILDEKKDATILSIDIKRYFYSVRVNMTELLEEISKKYRLKVDFRNDTFMRLNEILQRIHRRYTEVVLPFIDKEIITDELDDQRKAILPVGLLSSGFIGNLILCDFDQQVVTDLNPAYYGRYVDDMLFVFSDRELKREDPLGAFLKSHFVKNKLLKADNKDVNTYTIFNHETLKIQKEKSIIEHFYHTESRAAINKFKNKINQQRSEFRFLPDEEKIDQEFDNEAFSLQYSESINKLRSIKEYKEDKYGASKFLAHKIFLACQLNHKGSAKERKELSKSNAQILTFFKGQTCIAFSSLWEKVATYFIINRDEQSLNKFIDQALSTINLVSTNTLTEIQLNRYKEDLKRFLIYSVATPYAVNLKFNVKAFGDKNELCHQAARNFRFSNMFRHNIVGVMGINYTELLYDDEVDLFDNSIKAGEFDTLYAPYMSPRFVHYDEINVISIYKTLSNSDSEKHEDINQKVSDETDSYYHLLNNEWSRLYREYTPTRPKLHETLLMEGNGGRTKYIRIIEDSVAPKSNKRIGIVNMKVNHHHISESMWNRPVLTTERRQQLFHILNTAIKEGCEMLVLPELSVPFQWLETLVNQCKRHNIAIITGLEYFHSPTGAAYNCVATILPVETRCFTTAKVILRVKNHYAPKEIKELIGRRCQIPRFKTVYHLIHWRKLYFTVYNCFELANIDDRALFKSKVDLIVATEWNADVNYYADIASSWVRDVHCYFIQVNTSNFGDSCIMQPSKSETHRMVTVKGGVNSTVLVEDLDIETLRQFQMKEHILQMDDKNYKMTPPEYDKNNVEKRLKDKPMI